jgi:hypothetical protein
VEYENSQNLLYEKDNAIVLDNEGHMSDNIEFVNGQMPRPLYPREEQQYLLNRRLRGPQSWSGRFFFKKKKSLTPAGL